MPPLQDTDACNSLLRGLPREPAGTIQRNSAWLIDLHNIVAAVES